MKKDALGNKRKMLYICSSDRLFTIYKTNYSETNNMYYIHKDNFCYYETITDREGDLTIKQVRDKGGIYVKSWSINNISFDTGNGAVQLQEFELINTWVPYDQAGGGELGPATAFGALGVAGSGIGTLDGTFRLTNGSKGNISPKYYSSGWKGGSRARVSTYSAAKVGNGISTGASVITTGMAYYDIATGNHQPITYVDAGVGTMGIIASGASYFAGVQIPYVGAAVAVYGAVRVTWDVSFYLGTQYGPSTLYGNNDYRWFK